MLTLDGPKIWTNRCHYTTLILRVEFMYVTKFDDKKREKKCEDN